ncbi:MAG: hypothetical protein OXG11_05605 [Chloroflexi bacterium]|nr:hypothetical protein [Chloroflexota bacterium]
MTERDVFALIAIVLIAVVLIVLAMVFTTVWPAGVATGILMPAA